MSVNISLFMVVSHLFSFSNVSACLLQLKSIAGSGVSSVVKLKTAAAACLPPVRILFASEIRDGIIASRISVHPTVNYAVSYPRQGRIQYL